MIESLVVNEFQDLVHCKSENQQSIETFLKINYEFKKGNIYGFCSDFRCGSWGLATALGGRCSQNYIGNIKLNNQKIQGEELKTYSCFISENKYDNISTEENTLTVKTCIEKALQLSSQRYTVSEIKDIFSLSDGRFERPIEYVSGEIWNISMAVNFAMGKEIFCFPWMNLYDISRFEIACELGIIKFLKDTGKIVLVPSNQRKILKKYCNHVILFKKEKVIYR